MKASRVSAAILFFVLLISPALLSCKSKGDPNQLMVIETNYGRIVIEFYPDSAPQNMANIQELARQGFYNGTKFHYVGTEQDRRTATALMGGDPNTISDPESSGTWGQGKPGQKTVPLEQSTYKFERGTFAAFRKSDDPNSASSQFLICIKANPQWNEQTRGLSQYSILGRVVEGMNVVDTIVRAMVERRIPANAGPDTDPRFVTRIYLVSRDDYKKQGNQSAMATGETLP